MAINQSLPSSSLMLNIAPAPAPVAGALPVATAPAQAGFQLLFQGSLQAQGGRMLTVGEGKPLPQGGEPLPEGVELTEAVEDADGMGSLTGAVIPTQALPESATAQATEAGGQLTLMSTAAPAETPAPEGSAASKGIKSPVGGMPAQAAGANPTPTANAMPGASPAPSVDARIGVQEGVRVQQAGIAQSMPTQEAPISASTAPVELKGAAQTAIAPDARSQASALAGTPTPANERSGAQGQAAQMAQANQAAQLTQAAGQSPVTEVMAASEAPALPAAAPASLQAGGASSSSEPALTVNERPISLPAGQVAATTGAFQPAPGAVPAEGSASPALSGTAETGQRVPPSVGQAPPEAGIRADIADDGAELSPVQSGNVLRTSVVNSSTQGNEVTDLTGGRDAAMAARPDGGRPDTSAARIQVEAGAVRGDVAAAALNAADAGSRDEDGGQQTRHDGQSAAAQLASATRVSAGGGATAQPSTFAEQLQQQMQQQLADPRWGRQMGERAIMMAQHGPRSAQIQLDPPELGAMQIRIHVQGQDQVSVSFTSASPMVRDALEQQLPRLREMFADQGLNLQDSSVSDEARQRDADPRDRGSDNGSGAGRYAGGGEAEDADMAVISQAALGLVDYYA